MNVTMPIFQAFDYEEFPNQDLVQFAQDTGRSFFGFVRQTFDGLIEIGRALQNLQYECLNTDKNAKKVFSKWLDSFGALRYIAKSAMDMYNWFKDLDPRIQQLIRENVQNWKISALRLLRHLTTEVLKEVVISGKKSAKQIKQLIARDSKTAVKSSLLPAQYQETDSLLSVSYQDSNLNGTESIESNPDVELAPGVRIVVKSNDAWNGSTGIITSIHQEGQFWVLLDNTVAQGDTASYLFKHSQLQPEVKIVGQAPVSKKMYSSEELQALIQEALATKERETAELEQARYKEIHDAALEAAKREIIAAQQHARHMTKQKEQLTEQLQQALDEIQRLRSLQAKNQQLEQRVDDLEKALEGANKDSWNNTLNKQAVKAINREVEKAVVPLMSEVERLKNLNADLKQELAQLDAFSSQQQQELDNYRHLSSQGNETQADYVQALKQINQEVPTKQELQYH
ncbi:hypothetical protein NIES4071_106370 (plasmid) [Calothrix sp. NIES-4071]|nr:hypothetical protein NIES4071_106370 [Calothrix sp. NIES-4071]BAZ65055.1 hypothetical protein NIES4105_107880 [Calothrix sp. NIES-4105]